MRGFFSQIYVIFLACILIPVHLLGQGVELQRAYPFSLPETEVLLRLDQDWQHDGLRYLDVPFELEGIQSGTFTCVFDFDQEIPSDSIYLYFGGLAWEAELEFNDQFLGIQSQPLKPWAVGIHKDWVKKEENELKLRLHIDEVHPLYPKAFLGIVRSVSILSQAQWLRRKRLRIPTIPRADTVGIVAPFFRTSDYSFNTFEALRNLYPLRQSGIKHVFFPFPVSEQYQALCVQLGFVIVDSLDKQTYVCPVNAYPYEAVGYPFSPQFWLEQSGDVGVSYGNLYLWDNMWVRAVPESDHVLLALLILFPLFVAFFIKLINPSFFALQFPLLLTPKRYVDTPNETLYTNTSLLWSLVWIRSLSLGVFLTLLIYYIKLENQWNLLNIFREWSLATELYYGEKKLINLLAISVFMIAAWLLIKYLIIAFIGQIFRIKSMVSRIASLDVMGTFPMILLLPIPMALILFTNQLWGGVIGFLLVCLLIAYIGRQAYVLYIGLDRFFAFSSAMKILYICTFIIVPYMVWF